VTTHLVAAPEQAGQRLDQFLSREIPSLSRSQIQRLIRSGHVSVARGDVKPGLIVTAGLGVDVDIPAPTSPRPEPESLPLAILYDDADIVVVNKTAGMVVHPAAGHAAGTLVNALLHHVRGLSGIGGTERPGIVHRLDRGTSGVMVVAKHDTAHRELSRQFHDREVEKEYQALIWGAVQAGARLDTPIGRSARHRLKMTGRSVRGRAAVTHIVEVDKFRGVSLVRVRLGTGRTHQIRVHLSEAGHPVVGDELYGGARDRLPADLAILASLRRPFLHASRLTLTHPRTGQRMTFDAPLPTELQTVIDRLQRPRS